MKTNILLLAILFVAFAMSAQVGVNTTDPQTTLDVNGDFRVRAVPDNTDINDRYLVVDANGYVRRTTFDLNGTFVPEFIGYSTADDVSQPDTSIITRINSIGTIFNNGNFNIPTSSFSPSVNGIYRVTITITSRREGNLAALANYTYGFARSTGAGDDVGVWVARFSLLGRIIDEANIVGHAATFTTVVFLSASETYYFGHASDTRIIALPIGGTGSGLGTYYSVERLIQ